MSPESSSESSAAAFAARHTFELPDIQAVVAEFLQVVVRLQYRRCKVQAPPAKTNERTNPGLNRGAEHPTHTQRHGTTKLRGPPKVQTLNARKPFLKASATAKHAKEGKTVEPF